MRYRRIYCSTSAAAGSVISISVPRLSAASGIKNGEYVYIIAAPQAHWLKLADIIGRPELADDPRFKTVPVRHAHAAEVNVYVEEWTEKLTVEEIIAELDKAGIPAAKVLSVHEFCSSIR